MMHSFLSHNRDDLIRRCAEKVARRPQRLASPEQLRNGVPMFLDQLTQTLAADASGEVATSERISGLLGAVAPVFSEMSVSASAHGRRLLELGYTVEQVVHDYGDLCQAVTDLAFERDAPFAIDEYRTLNRCLDNAIADAVSEFSFYRDVSLEESRASAANERLGLLVHELRNALQSGNLSLRALELGSLPLSGATGEVLKRSMATMGALLAQTLQEVKGQTSQESVAADFAVADLIATARAAGELRANEIGCTLAAPTVDPVLLVHANFSSILSALENLLHNAFKFTHAHTEVKLVAHGTGSMVVVEVSDHCGGLPPGDPERLFLPFVQQSGDRSGVGLGLYLARKAVEADGGKLTVRDVAGIGCIFAITLPRIVTTH